MIATPLAWWLARSKAAWKEIVASVVQLPMVLPPTVLGFYLLVALGPSGPGGAIASLWGARTLAFTFWGLVIGSIFASMPFVVQPIRNAFAAIGDRPLEVAATLRASPTRAFWTVALPLASPGLLSGAVLGFAHTVGEFGVVLMIGGAIPGRTKVHVDRDLRLCRDDAVARRQHPRRHDGRLRVRGDPVDDPDREAFRPDARMNAEETRSAPNSAGRSAGSRSTRASARRERGDRALRPLRMREDHRPALRRGPEAARRRILPHRRRHLAGPRRTFLPTHSARSATCSRRRACFRTSRCARTSCSAHRAGRRREGGSHSTRSRTCSA